MSISNSNLLSAIRGLEDAVYFKDSRGRYASLPDNNSMRIDILSGKVDILRKMVENNTGGDIPNQLNTIVQYLDGSESAENFPKKQPTEQNKDIIVPRDTDTDKGNYTNVLYVLQKLYNQQGGGDSGIVVDTNSDAYLKYILQTEQPEYDNFVANYTSGISSFPSIFPYIYKNLNYLAKYVFEKDNQFDVYEDMTVN